MENILESGNPPVALGGSVAEEMSSTGAEGTDTSTVAGDSGTVKAVVPPGFEGDIELTTQTL